MRKIININIPEPCHENWQEMTPQEQGRHCKACDKTVFDFTNKTDEQIVKAFIKYDKLCGRFKSTQLNKDLVFARKSKNSYLSYLATGLLSLVTSLSFQKITAQEKPKTELTTNLEKKTQVKGKPAVSLLKTKILKGTVKDKQDLPLPGINIIIKNTTNGTQTDFDGNFEIEVKVGQTLSFSYVGLITEEILITEEVLKVDKIVKVLEEDPETMGEVVVVAGFPDYSWRHEQNKKTRKQKRLERKEARKKRKSERQNN